VKKDHKRIDYLVREFAAWSERTAEPRPYLLVAGARQDETDEVVELARRLAPERIRFLLDCPRADMPAFYAALDAFVLPSLFEMMPIAVLEALASGLPVLANRHPVLEWMVGPGGACVDMTADGGLAGALAVLAPGWVAERGGAARGHALRLFARDVVIGEYEGYYRRVLGRDQR
jgi:glycosyltransferase involved in cell wall biosynthesis